MGILLCEQNFRDVLRRNKSVRGEIGKIVRTHKHTHAAKLVVRMASCCTSHQYLVCRSVSAFPVGPTGVCLAIYLAGQLFKTRKKNQAPPESTV